MKFYPRKCISLKHILALPTWGLTCTDFEEKPFEVANFDLGHPVPTSNLSNNKENRENGIGRLKNGPIMIFLVIYNLCFHVYLVKVLQNY